VNTSFPVTSTGAPGTSQLAGPNNAGLLAVIVDPNGHKLYLYKKLYTMDRWGNVSPYVKCRVCNWQDSVCVDNSPDFDK
jgi:hypothetical protein